MATRWPGAGDLSAVHSGHIEGITLCGFAQLLEIERKTCTLQVSSEGRTGFLYFQEGELIHAEVAGGASGAEALYDMESWSEPEIEIDQVCQVRNRTVFCSLTELLLEGARRADEEARRRTTESTAAAEPHEGDHVMSNLKESLAKMSEINGFLGACIVDSASGMMLGAVGGGQSINLEVAAAGNTEVVRAKRKTIASLGLKDEIEDMLITLGRQYHLIRPLSVRDGLFAYLVLDKAKSNLAMARLTLADLEKALTL